MTDTYIEELKTARLLCRKRLEDGGLYVEDMQDEIGLAISLTKFGLDAVYANLPQTEIEYIVDNEVEL